MTPAFILLIVRLTFVINFTIIFLEILSDMPYFTCK